MTTYACLAASGVQWFISWHMDMMDRLDAERFSHRFILVSLLETMMVVERGAVVEWLERLGYGTESRRKA